MASLLGFAYAFAAAIAFGVQNTPVKKYEISDGTTFQWFMCSGIFGVAILVSLFFGELGKGYSLEVLLGGVLWGLSNYGVLPLVKLLGIGLGFCLYHFVNLIVGYIVGRFGIFGVKPLQGNLPLCDFGCFLILISFIIMIFVEECGDHGPPLTSAGGQTPLSMKPSLSEGVGQEYQRRYHKWWLGEEKGSKDQKIFIQHMAYDLSASETGSTLRSVGGVSVYTRPMPVVPAQLAAPQDREAADLLPQAISDPIPAGKALDEPLIALAFGPDAVGRGGKSKSSNKIIGVLLALLAGGLAGVQSVPASLYNEAHPDVSATSVVFPHCMGIWIISSFIYIVYSSIAALQGWPVPQSVIRPAYLSGAIWALGFAFMIGGIRDLGYSVGYTLDAVGPTIVASVLSIFVFNEFKARKQLMLYLIAFTLQPIGVVLIASFGKQ